jgi:hypothetical protein
VASITKYLIFQHKFALLAGSMELASKACDAAPTGFARGLPETLDSGPLA